MLKLTDNCFKDTNATDSNIKALASNCPLFWVEPVAGNIYPVTTSTMPDDQYVDLSTQDTMVILVDLDAHVTHVEAKAADLFINEDQANFQQNVIRLVHMYNHLSPDLQTIVQCSPAFNELKQLLLDD